MKWWQRPAGLAWSTSLSPTLSPTEGDKGGAPAEQFRVSSFKFRVSSVVSWRSSMTTAAPVLVASYSGVDMVPHFSRVFTAVSSYEFRVRPTTAVITSILQRQRALRQVAVGCTVA